jgi:hypothetical protein
MMKTKNKTPWRNKMGKGVIEQRRPKIEDPVEAPSCKHHWVIESPRGALSEGHCKVCGEVREFRNSTTDYVWDDDSGSGYNPWRGQRPAAKVAADDEMAAASPARDSVVLV